MTGMVFYEKHLSNIHQTVSFGDYCTIHSHVWIGKDVKIGNNVKIQAFCFVPTGVTIEDNVFLGPGVKFANDPKLMCQGKTYWKPTLVKKGARIGMGALINAGVMIGKNAIIGMGAVVLKDVPDGETWVGNPARKI